jgi:hypothetical protein
MARAVISRRTSPGPSTSSSSALGALSPARAPCRCSRV